MTFKLPKLSANQTAVLVHFVTVFGAAFATQMVASTTGKISISALYAGLNSAAAAGVLAVLRAVSVIGSLDYSSVGLSFKVKSAGYQILNNTAVMFVGTLGAGLATGAEGATTFPDLDAGIVAAISAAVFAVVQYAIGLIPGPKADLALTSANTPLQNVTDAMDALNTANETLRSGVSRSVYNRMHPPLASVSGYLVALKAWISALPSPAPVPTPTPTPTPTGSGIPVPAGYAESQRFFDTNFAGTTLDQSAWNFGITSRAADGSPWNGRELNGKVYSQLGSTNLEVLGPEAATVNNGLKLAILKGSPVSGYAYTGGCVNTYGKMELADGMVVIRAKQPGQPSWPAIWFLRGSKSSAGADNGEIDDDEGGMTGRASGPQNDIIASTYHLSTSSTPNSDIEGDATGIDLTADFHDYGMEKKPGQSIKYYLDGKEVEAPIESGVNEDPMFLILNNSVAAPSTSGWHTTGTPPSPCEFDIAGVAMFGTRS